MTKTDYPDKISDYVYLHARQQPDTEALVWQDCRTTYAQFARQTEQISRALLASGVKHGDRVAFLGAPRPEYLLIMMGVVDIGAIWVGMHPRYQLNEFRHVLDLAAPKLLFSLDEIDGRTYYEEFSVLSDEFPKLEQIIIFDNPTPQIGVSFKQFLQSATQTGDNSWVTARNNVKPDDAAVIIFTSGTTGKPKGSMNSHYGLVHCAHIEFSRWPSDSIRVLQNMPINHIANIGMMSSYALVAGGTLVFMDKFDVGEMLGLIEKEKITFWLQAPAMFHMAVNHENFEHTDLSSLEYIIWGGGPMPDHLVRLLADIGPRLAMAYGMTELTAYVTYSDADADSDILAETIGKPEPRYELRLVKKDGEIAGSGESGEIQARGRWLMNGYYNQPEATAEAFTEDGWFRTGDVALLRKDGNWKLIGRTKEMYKSGGYNIYPREIEICLEEHPDIAMSAVIGMPDELYVEVGYAFIQPMPGRHLELTEIDNWCRKRLANYKIPKTFEVIDELPRLPIGKIDKQGLRRRLGLCDNV